MNLKEQGQPRSCVPSFVSTSPYLSLTLRPPHLPAPLGCYPSALHANLTEGIDSRNRGTITLELDHKKIATIGKRPMFVNNLLL